jgi:hypothetical protein
MSELPYKVELKTSAPLEAVWVPGDPIDLRAYPDEPRQLEDKNGTHRTCLLRHDNTLWFVTHWGDRNAPRSLLHYEGKLTQSHWFREGPLTQTRTGVYRIILGKLGMSALAEEFGDLREHANWLGSLLKPRVVPGTLVLGPDYRLLYTRLA